MKTGQRDKLITYLKAQHIHPESKWEVVDTLSLTVKAQHMPPGGLNQMAL